MSKRAKPVPEEPAPAMGHASTVTIPKTTFDWLMERSERLKQLEK